MRVAGPAARPRRPVPFLWDNEVGSLSRPGTRPHRTRSRRGSGDRPRAEMVAAAKTLSATADAATDASTRAVADAVGVSAMSIYLHLADKQALLDAAVGDVFAELDAC
jgi:AcrR family transcriptional regulator